MHQEMLQVERHGLHYDHGAGDDLTHRPSVDGQVLEDVVVEIGREVAVHARETDGQQSRCGYQG